MKILEIFIAPVSFTLAVSFRNYSKLCIILEKKNTFSYCIYVLSEIFRYSVFFLQALVLTRVFLEHFARNFYMPLT
jgi:hypothetical protein